MHRTLARCVLIAACVVAPVFANAQDSTVRLAQDIKFGAPPIPGYPEVVTLYGDTTKPGVFGQRVKFAPGFKIQPHWHPDEVRTAVVLSGTLYFSYGDTWDESKLKAFPAGSFFAEPPKAPHFAWAKDGEVIVQVTGIGPSGVTMVERQKSESLPTVATCSFGAYARGRKWHEPPVRGAAAVPSAF
jgi:quercetin dioxygenase-like cupin family protein